MQTTTASVFDNDRAPGYWILLIGIPVVIALASILFVPMRAPQPIYLAYAHEFVDTGHIAETVYPVEFAWLTGISLKAFGTRGPELLQAALYLLIVILVWGLARKAGATARYALFAALGAAIYPRLAEGVTKVWDVQIAVLLMVLVMLCTVCLLVDGLKPAWVFAIAVAFGLSLAQRSNMLLLLPLPLYVCFTSEGTRLRKTLAVAFGGVASILVFVAVNTLAHGSFFVSQNGPYNFVQGHNEYSMQVMLRDLTSEPTVPLIMRADGMEPVREADEGNPKLQRYFVRRAFAYMRTHPLQEIELLPVKLWTLFRPDTRLNRRSIPLTAMNVGMSLILPVWIILLLRQKARTGLDGLDWIFISAFGLYVLPFLLTCSDPRYQIPIEICLLAHMGCMASRKTILGDLRSRRHYEGVACSADQGVASPRA